MPTKIVSFEQAELLSILWENNRKEELLETKGGRENEKKHRQAESFK